MTSPLPSPLLALRSYGAVTNIGNSVPQTLASWLIQARRTRRISLEGFADPFTVADCVTLTDGQCGANRLCQMLQSSIAEALEPLPTFAQEQTLNILLLPTWLGDKGQAQLIQATADQWPCDADSLKILQSDSITAAWQALDYAYQALSQRPRIQQVVIATADSLCEPALLRQSAEAGYLMQTSNSEGFVAGEAAACVVLNRIHDITKLPGNLFALHRPAWARNERHWWPGSDQPDPAALATVVQSAMQNAGMNGTHISHLLSDMDGSNWRAQVESDALQRTLYRESGPLPHWRLATLLGQVGLATGLLGWILPAICGARRIEPINTVLNWGVDPGGLAAACVLERSPN